VRTAVGTRLLSTRYSNCRAACSLPCVLLLSDVLISGILLLKVPRIFDFPVRSSSFLALFQDNSRKRKRTASCANHAVSLGGKENLDPNAPGCCCDFGLTTVQQTVPFDGGFAMLQLSSPAGNTLYTCGGNCHRGASCTSKGRIFLDKTDARRHAESSSDRAAVSALKPKRTMKLAGKRMHVYRVNNNTLYACSGDCGDPNCKLQTLATARKKTVEAHLARKSAKQAKRANTPVKKKPATPSDNRFRTPARPVSAGACLVQCAELTCSRRTTVFNSEFILYCERFFFCKYFFSEQCCRDTAVSASDTAVSASAGFRRSGGFATLAA